jgi:protein tyrosine phosphatase (PTP) superfamily phosphohydrolase (DUF442 family)
MIVTSYFPSCRPSLRVALFALVAGAAFAGFSGLPNYAQVNSGVARGGQPTPDGFRNLAAMGTRTVVDLRGPGERSDSERKLVTSLGMRYVSIPMSSVRPPTTQEMAKIFEVLNDKSAAPVFVHCRRGADRTGTVLAIYRMEQDRWTNQKALDEARQYGMSWYQIPRQRFISSYESRSTGRPGPSAQESSDSTGNGSSAASPASNYAPPVR